jgi:uncharacterized membrane protein
MQNGRVRLTGLGAALLGLLLAAILAVLIGSQTVQAIGFVVIVIVVLVIAGDRLPRLRFGGGHDLGLQARQPPLEGKERKTPPRGKDRKTPPRGS